MSHRNLAVIVLIGIALDAVARSLARAYHERHAPDAAPLELADLTAHIGQPHGGDHEYLLTLRDQWSHP